MRRYGRVRGLNGLLQLLLVAEILVGCPDGAQAPIGGFPGRQALIGGLPCVHAVVGEDVVYLVGHAAQLLVPQLALQVVEGVRQPLGVLQGAEGCTRGYPLVH